MTHYKNARGDMKKKSKFSQNVAQSSSLYAIKNNLFLLNVFFLLTFVSFGFLALDIQESQRRKEKKYKTKKKKNP